VDSPRFELESGISPARGRIARAKSRGCTHQIWGRRWLGMWELAKRAALLVVVRWGGGGVRSASGDV